MEGLSFVLLGKVMYVHRKEGDGQSFHSRFLLIREFMGDPVLDGFERPQHDARNSAQHKCRQTQVLGDPPSSHDAFRG
jgi:hypothetical protein